MLNLNRFRNFLAGVAEITLLGQAPAATAQESAIDPGFSELAYLAATDAAAALDRVDLAILSHQASGADDPRRAFDLIQLKADLLLELGQNDDAAPLFAAQFRTVLDIDPIPLLQKAADLYEQTGDTRAALSQYKAILNEQRDGGQSSEILSGTFLQLARLSEKMNRIADADRYRADATATQIVPIAAPTAAARGHQQKPGFARSKSIMPTITPQPVTPDRLSITAMSVANWNWALPLSQSPTSTSRALSNPPQSGGWNPGPLRPNMWCCKA